MSKKKEKRSEPKVELSGVKEDLLIMIKDLEKYKEDQSHLPTRISAIDAQINNLKKLM